MPTPESAAFLARKPTVPPTFDGVNMLDNKAVFDARDAIIREQWVKQMMARLVREELGKCYAREGVNHLENCGRYRDRYIQLLKENKEKGFRGRQQNYDQKALAPALDDPENKERVRQFVKESRENGLELPNPAGPPGPEIESDYPTVQDSKGWRGTDKRRGNTIGFGPGGLGRF